MASLARAGRFMVLLQIALFVVSAVIMSGSVCHEVGIGRECFHPNCSFHPRCRRLLLQLYYSSAVSWNRVIICTWWIFMDTRVFLPADALDPSRRPICGGRPCGQRGLPYGGRPWSPSAVRWRDWATMIIAAQVATTTLLNQPGVWYPVVWINSRLLLQIKLRVLPPYTNGCVNVKVWFRIILLIKMDSVVSAIVYVFAVWTRSTRLPRAILL